MARNNEHSQDCGQKRLDRERREFHISRLSRQEYGVDATLFQLSGNVVFADFAAVRRLAQRVNEQRQAQRFPERAVKAGALNAMGLIDEILHFVVQLYRERVNGRVFEEALTFLENELGEQSVQATLELFCEQFPPWAVYSGEASVRDYLQTAGSPGRQTALEELLLLWLANSNPAFRPFQEFFDDRALQERSAYLTLIGKLEIFFKNQPLFGPDQQPLVEMLRSPAVAAPHSLPGQLAYIRNRWGMLLDRFFNRLLLSLDLIKEEIKTQLAGPAPVSLADLKAWLVEDGERERFSTDRDWMPRLVLLAKSAAVWLDQLSKKYGRRIATLDAIPDEELEQLRRWGISGLWLIGLWERSLASRRIKQICGNPEAMASAYALRGYQVAADLGGEAALDNLQRRASERGIRLAADMVPNHTGIDSPWVVEHPDWFIGLDESPFPAYTFSGPDLSVDERVEILLEDHYYDRSDAAVVFRWRERSSGRTRYIYHGNDGTRMPWNDTAQLNFLLPEVRQAVLQSILQVARRFPVIRFDAAMTLTRRHFQRLWFPPPGSGGDIPSRAEHGLERGAFDRQMPEEFWRQVVEHAAGEAPDTLLLAEAFWLMEGYFVRSLGMHRVYNSAFMNFLKNEENEKFRFAVKSVLEFNPEILKRFVNFMNNPDEETAVAQFGKGDKYFGVCTLMVTLPGLPMFGHGQIEGFWEKYGMEYSRAYFNEQPDSELVARHEQEIFPLLHKRQLFAEVRDFRLYDFYLSGGRVDENVIAFSNRYDQERALVVYHNRYVASSGWIRLAAAFRRQRGSEEAGTLARQTVGEGLGLPDRDSAFVVFRELLSGLEYIRGCRELHEKGLYLELAAYQTQVFLDFRLIEDDAESRYAQVERSLNGRGVVAIEEALRQIRLQPLRQVLGELFAPVALKECWQALHHADDKPGAAVAERLERVFTEANRVSPVSLAWPEAQAIFRQRLTAIQLLVAKVAQTVLTVAADEPVWVAWNRYLCTEEHLGLILLNATLLDILGQAVERNGSRPPKWTLRPEWRLEEILQSAFSGLGFSQEQQLDAQQLLALFADCGCGRLGAAETTVPELLQRLVRFLSDLFERGEGRRLLQVNRHDDILWFSQQGFETVLAGLLLAVAVALPAAGEKSKEHFFLRILELAALGRELTTAARGALFQVDRFRDLLKKLAEKKV